MEATTAGVPILAVPVVGDQPSIAKVSVRSGDQRRKRLLAQLVERAGVGVTVRASDLETTGPLESAIKEMTGSSK